MKYSGCINNADAELSVGREGLAAGGKLFSYADMVSLRPVNHRVFIGMSDGSQIEISMLGRSYDGFWEELTGCFGSRSLEALFVDERQIMLCEGEYHMPEEAGRCNIALYPDSVCILPQTARSVRIPLCYTDEIRVDGYEMQLVRRSGESFTVGRMGYDTKPFFERTMKAADAVKRKRAAAIAGIPVTAPFTEKGLFRTENTDQYWNAAFGCGVCAVELFTGDDAATYLYRFSDEKRVFLEKLEEAMEAVGTHREIIFLDDEHLAQKDIYRMAVDRTGAVRFLRSRSAGRIIHSASHAEKLKDFLQNQ